MTCVAARQLGPQLQQTKQASDRHVILHPCPTFGGWPEARMGTWTEMQQARILQPLAMLAGAYLYMCHCPCTSAARTKILAAIAVTFRSGPALPEVQHLISIHYISDTRLRL